MPMKTRSIRISIISNPYLQPSGKAYGELKEFIAEADGLYYWYDFMANEVTGGTVDGNQSSCKSAKRSYLKTTWVKRRTMIVKKNMICSKLLQVNFKIVEINIQDTNRK